MAEEMTTERLGESRAERKDRTRARIIEATIDSVAEHGVEGTSVSMIVERAHVSRGLAGYHFGSKSILLAAAFQSLADDYRALLGIVPDQEPAFGSDVEGLLEQVIRRSLDDKQTAWFGFWALARTDPELRRANREVFDETSRYLGDILAAIAEKRGRIIDAERAGRALSVTIEGAWLHLTVGTEGFTLEEAISVCRRHAGDLLRSDEE